MDTQNTWQKISRRLTLGLTLSLALASAPATADETPKPKISPITRVAADPNWQEEYAYTLGVQAYTFAFPWYYMQLLRWKWVTQPAANDRTASMPMNSFWHGRHLTDASYKEGGTPNNDTLYSIAFVDVGKEPVVVSVPDMGERYYSFELAGYDSDNFDYIGKRATGSKASHYVIAGPNWKGKLPKGLRVLSPSPTPMFMMLGRTVVNGKDDLPAVHTLQNQMKLTPLSQWGKKTPVSNEHRDVWSPFANMKDPMADWKTINRSLTENPPPAHHSSLLRQFAQIGIGPGQDVDKVDEATRKGLLRALEAGKRIVTGAGTFSVGTTYINGWRYFKDSLGRAGLTDDFLFRAGSQSLGGIIANDPIEAMYPSAKMDEHGEVLTGAHRYVLRFAKGDLPPVKAFWSLTGYGNDFNLIDNPLNRYSIGDRSPNLQRDADGGLTIYVQKDSPGAGKEGNWLPVTDAEFYLVLRMYLPEEKAVKKEWVLPPLRRLE